MNEDYSNLDIKENIFIERIELLIEKENNLWLKIQLPKKDK